MLNEQTYRQNWINPVHRIGRWTLSLVCITSLFPVAYLYFGYDVFPPLDWIWKDLLLITAGFGLIWIIEPLTFRGAIWPLFPATSETVNCRRRFLRRN